MRVAMVQYSPKIGRVQENINKVTKLCEKLQPRSIDLLCLPEMAFTGYLFPNAAAIAPYLEDPHSGPTSRFCAELAARLHCYVVGGFPERLAPHEVVEAPDANGTPATRIGANSAVLYDPRGARVGDVYRKTHLFETDTTWAKAGTGFATFTLPSPLGTLALGICMDLNPQPPTMWTLAEGPYELAEHCRARKANVLVLLNSWLESGWEEDDGDDRDSHTINYWVARLRPLWARNDFGLDTCISGAEAPDEEGKETLVVICNRCGEEDGKKFAGSSTLFSMRRDSGRARLLHAMGRRAEGVEVWTIPSTSGSDARASVAS
ncbi:carbon-nitrogen hydrolase [Sparassis latifolia]|uniref:Protein N-terminal amidase n=1 Tax=Sparassis crispa TaxID=139825 RepID=A0A401GTR1_9APHY|nr:Protein N-terminal amidase [Sparassis crispa]GBE85124.1 Protein N-terminal amidase [Sparassis crispa]